MRFLIIHLNYPNFLAAFYTQNARAARLPYRQQWRLLMDQCFGLADFYSSNLNALGHEAEGIVANCNPLQRQWAREHAPALWAAYPLYHLTSRAKAWQMAVLRAQVEWFKPDVLYILPMNWMDTAFLRAVRPEVRIIVGQIACSLSPNLDYGAYDLILSSFPHYIERFKGDGISSEYFRLALEPRVLDYLQESEYTLNTVFIGSLSRAHRRRVDTLEQVSRSVQVDFWGPGVEGLPHDSPLRINNHGEVWGLDMYRILARSRIGLNCHIGVAENYANNMRLYEVAGVGTCLVTDMKDNLKDLFEVGREVVAYTCAAECVEKVQYLLEHDKEREAIATAGQVRTLCEHTYYHRMQELIEIIKHYL